MNMQNKPPRPTHLHESDRNASNNGSDSTTNKTRCRAGSIVRSLSDLAILILGTVCHGNNARASGQIHKLRELGKRDAAAIGPTVQALAAALGAILFGIELDTAVHGLVSNFRAERRITGGGRSAHRVAGLGIAVQSLAAQERTSLLEGSTTINNLIAIRTTGLDGGMSPFHGISDGSGLLSIRSDRNSLGLGKIRHKLLVVAQKSATLVSVAVHAGTAALRTDLGILGTHAAVHGLIAGLAAEGCVTGGDGGADAVLAIAEESLGTKQRTAVLGIGTTVFDLRIMIRREECL